MKVYIAIGKGGYDDETIEAVFIDKNKYEDFPYMFFVYWANEKGFAEHGTTAIKRY